MKGKQGVSDEKKAWRLQSLHVQKYCKRETICVSEREQSLVPTDVSACQQRQLREGRVPLVAAISGPYTACLSSEQKLALNIVCMAWGRDRLASCASPCEASRRLIYKATNF